MTNTNAPAPEQIADLLEREAYRIRTAAAFPARQKYLSVAFSIMAHEVIFSDRLVQRDGEESARMSAISDGIFELISLSGGELPVEGYDYDEDDYHDVYSRTLVMSIEGNSVQLQFLINDAHSGKEISFRKWCEADKPTQSFIEKNPNIRNMIEELFSEPQHDFYQAESRLGKSDAQIVIQKFSDCIVREHQASSTISERARRDESDSPSP